MSAARPKYGFQTPVHSQVIALNCGGALAAFVAQTITALVASRRKIVGIRFCVGTKGGSFGTGTLDVQVGGVSILTAAFDVAAATATTPVDKEIASLTAASQDVAANAELTIVTAVSGGSSPTWANGIVQIDYVDLGG